MTRAEAERDENEHERYLLDKIRTEMQEQMRAKMQEQMRAEMHEQIRACVQEQMLALKQPLEAEPSPQPPVSTAPVVAVEPSRRSGRVKRAKQQA